ncbi:uncharacterized protein N7482_004939 [Penicillium canariense]|uniref:Uncharacterized protein n=1 Tax=Penicillium canariense TaxID=189055 RepID=A0A9W9I3K4_9EURO|nr:uncharacterized protein N7482_004939 [Penicillium canariense]KAJ5166158.1 hypothetical protein N7482_004939 [Penicillium canariense]
MGHGSKERQYSWNSSLSKRLAGDVGAATISATLVAPAITIIDRCASLCPSLLQILYSPSVRALVEKSSWNQPLIRGLRTHALSALKHPARFIFQVPFGIIWALYAATYTVANGTDTIGKELSTPATGMITFLSTTIVNVPLGVWKDIRFAQVFGTQRAPSDVDAVRKSLAQSRGVARAAAAVFLARDCVTIFGSFTLAPKLAATIPDDWTSHPHAKPVISQLTVPVLTQLVATPLHLLGLDLYMRQHAVPLSDRIVQSQRYLGSSTVVRCIRIIPAFGFGCLANMELRSMFHRKADGGVEVGIEWMPADTTETAIETPVESHGP